MIPVQKSDTPYHVEIIRAPDGLPRWPLVLKFLALRKEVFIDHLNWDLQTDNIIEYEQYDTAGVPYYVIAHQSDDVLAGCRLIRCDNRMGAYSYMIRDAYYGTIDLPSDICSKEPPTDSNSWELTRLVAKPGNSAAVQAVMQSSYTLLSNLGAKRCLCLSSPVVQRLARMSGYKTDPLGKTVQNASGSFLAYEIAIDPMPDQSLSSSPTPLTPSPDGTGRLT